MNSAIFVLLLMLGMILVFGWGKIPFGVVALCIPVILQGTGILTASEAWSGFSNTGVLIFVPLFMLGAVLKKSSFMFRLKKLVHKLSTTKGGQTKLLFVFGFCSLLLCNFMNATASIALMAPIIASCAEAGGFTRRQLNKWCGDISCCGRQIFPFGMTLTSYLTLNAVLEAAGAEERFDLFDPLLAKTPVVLVWFIFMVFFGIRLYKNWDGEDTYVLPASVNDSAEGRGTCYTPAQDRLAYIVFFGGILSMLIGSIFTSIPILVWAFIFAILGVVLQLVTAKECLDNMAWISILLAACGIPLTTAVTKTGADAYIASFVKWLLGGSGNLYVVTGVFFLVAMVVSQFMNDIATYTIFTALAAVAAVNLGLDARIVVMAPMVGALTSTWTPMASSAQALCFGTGGYTMWPYFKASVLPTLVFMAIYLAWMPIYQMLL